MSKHYSQVAVIRCADDRYCEGRELRKAYLRILKAEKITDRFPLFDFGAALEFQLEGFSPALSFKIETMKALGINKVLIIEHMDCGAYMKHFGKLTREEERELHLKSIRAAKEFIAEKAPEIEVVAYLQDAEAFEKID